MMTNRLSAGFLIAVVTVCCLIFARAQRRSEEASRRPNFFELQKRYNEKFRSKDRQRREQPDDRERDDDEVKFRRFEEFWKLRIDNKGDFTTYYQNLKAVSEKQDCDNCGQACYKSNWTFLGPSTMPDQNMGAIVSLWVNPANSSEILAGTFSSGVYKTTNGGTQWDRLTKFGCQSGCSDFPVSGGVQSIVADPANPAIIYIAVGIYRGMTEFYSYGVYKSINGGLNWCPTDLKFDPTEYASLKKIVMDPADSNTLFAIAGNKIYKTTNGGASWKSNVIFTAQNNHDILDIAISRNANPGLYFSEAPDTVWGGCPLNNGKIWFDSTFTGSATDITNQALGIPTSANSEVELEKALFAVTSTSVSVLAMSDAVGCTYATIPDRIIARNLNNSPLVSSSWTRQINPPGMTGSMGATFGSAFAVSPLDDKLMFVGSDHGGGYTDDLYISKTGGASFTLNKDCLHPDLRVISFARKDLVPNGEVWIIGNDGGVGEVSGISSALPSATPITCKNINNVGLTVTDFLGISNSETDPNRIYAGAQDNGVFDNTTGAWRTYPWADGYDAVSDITNPDIAYVGTNGGFWRTTNGGSWAGLPANATFALEASAWVPPLFVDSANALYLGKKNVWRSYNPAVGIALKQLSNWGSSEPSLREIYVPPLNSSIIIAAKDQVTWGATGIARIYRTNSAYYNSVPSAWNNITFNLPVQWQVITGITSDEKGENIWVSMGNFGGHVFLLEKGSTTWKDVSDGLPNLPVNVIKYWDGSKDDSMFVGTDVGVYYRNQNLNQWKRISCGLPNLLISDLEINYRVEKLRVSTRGAGIWETSLTAIKNQGCSDDPYLAVSYTGGSGPQNKDLKNNSIITDALSLSPISIVPKNTCCIEPCEIAPAYSWKVYKVFVPSGLAALSGAGQNSPVTFSPDFGNLGGPFAKRFNYRVELTGRCNDKTCPNLTIQFNRW